MKPKHKSQTFRITMLDNNITTYQLTYPKYHFFPRVLVKVPTALISKHVIENIRNLPGRRPKMSTRPVALGAQWRDAPWHWQQWHRPRPESDADGTHFCPKSGGCVGSKPAKSGDVAKKTEKREVKRK